MKIRRDVGPLDQRRRLTRCQPCAKRRIKCEGGSPCEYCTRTKKLCKPQVASVGQTQFVSCTSHPSLPIGELPLQVRNHPDSVYLDYFTLFLQRCQFTPDFTNLGHDLLPLLQTCPPLRKATIAIGALEASRRATVKSQTGRTSPDSVALASYCESISKLQDRLQSSDALQCQGVLWCTLLLGLFELMTEVSGDRWAKHMLYGTSRILQSTGTTSLSDRLDKQLFSAFRLLEANRSILYGDETFLSQQQWLRQQQDLMVSMTGPMESIFNLVIQISSFSKRFFDQIESIPAILRPNNPLLSLLAQEGCYFQQQLQQWHNETIPRFDSSDSYCKLALANYHALQLFLCRNYTFYQCWEQGSIPSLTTSEIEIHTTAIVAQSDDVLKHGNIPGVLILFPLRMAGVNAQAFSQKDEISRLLDRVSQKGFIVSERIKVDLQELWEYERLVSGVV